MPKSLTRTQDSLSPSLLAFKPRQVLLANRNLQMKPNTSAQTLSPDQKGPLLYAVARFLEGNGFSKTLKKFLSEAPIEKNGMKDSSLDLGEMYCKYSEMCSKDKTSVNSQDNGKDPEELKKPEQVEVADKNKEKKKKKGKIVSDTPDGVEQRKLEPLSGEVEESLKDHTSVKEKGVSDTKTEKKSKDKKKKKSKSKDDSVTPDVEQGGVEAKQDANGTIETIADENVVDVRPKVKKNKKESSGGEDKKVVHMGDASDTVLKKEDFKTSEVDASDDKENKSSKKRKRLDSEVNDSEPGKSKEDESADTSSMKKSVKKQHSDSTEAKTIKAFQRVKLDEVVFTDEKLKDNSYWAKDGADIGYGAKAQEILGQVRGKDFRHEKTKKKRGSYRGGQIDLQSHSVKFNYSDED